MAISVVAPAYNVGDKINRCIDSILSQTYRDFESLLVDDGSTDCTGANCDQYALDNEHVITVHQNNFGVSAARNVGIELSLGEFLSFVDSDDYVEDNFLQVLLNSAEATSADITICNCKQHSKTGDDQLLGHGFAEGYCLNQEGIRDIIYKHIYENDSTAGYFSLWNKLFKKEIVQKNNICLNEDMSFAEDMLFVMDCLKHCTKMSFSTEALYNYEVQEDGLFSSYRPSFIYDIMKCYTQLRNQTAPEKEDKKSIGLEIKYYNYINRYISDIVKYETDKYYKIKELYKNNDVQQILDTIAGMSGEELKSYNMDSYELRIPKLVKRKKLNLATVYTLYCFNKEYPLRMIRDDLYIIKEILKTKYCSKVKSLYWSLKTHALFVICPKSKVIISKGAKVLIDGEFYFNVCHDGKNNQPGTLYLAPGATLCVKGGFRVYSGAYITVAPKAELSFKNGFINNNGKISCFKKIEIGDGAKISEDVIIRDSDNHSIKRDGFESTKPIAIGDHVWIGLRATILKGVNIGNGAVVAAGAIVNKDVKEKTLVGGAPAKVLKESIDWE